MKQALMMCTIVAGLWVMPVAGLAQDRTQTLADIRQDLTVLYVETQRLKRELSTSGQSGVSLGGGTAQDRAQSIEGELQRLTAKIEQLEFRIDSIVRDATARIADLEFRLVELEGGDVSKLGETTTLGGAAAAPQTPAVAAVQSSGGTDAGGTELAASEQADFDAAQAALTSGDTSLAADSFASFTQNYPGSPLEAQARIGRGQALEQGGDAREAARSYLEAYSSNPAGAEAPKALYLLGRALGKLGKVSEACVTLGEVGARHPGTPAASDAQMEMTALNCS
ncbi:MAG: tol-pal system protein YbgF [Pseudomonadota bacterium]